VSQSNTAAVQNEVTSQSTTGGNSVSNSTGDANIQTGNSTNQTAVENTVNTNTAQTNTCCINSSSSAEIAGNGSQSTNSVTVTTTNMQTVSATNSAVITNTI